MTAADQPVQAVHCPACNTAYPWKPAIAGRKVKCRCGAVMRMPMVGGVPATLEHAPESKLNAQPQEEALLEPVETPEESYDLALPEEEAARLAPQLDVKAVRNKGRCPSCGLSVKPEAAICLNCGYSFLRGKKLQTDVAAPGAEPARQATTHPPPPPREPARVPVLEPDSEPEQPAAESSRSATKDQRINTLVTQVTKERERVQRESQAAMRTFRFKEFYLPLIMAVIGVGAIVGGGFWLNKDSLGFGLLFALGLLGVEVVVMMPLLLVAVFLAARIGGIGFGSLWTALLKLAAICVGPGAIADVLMLIILPIIFMVMGPTAMFMPFAVYLVFLGIPLAMLFDLDFNETSLTVAMAVVMRAVAILLLWSFL